MEDASARAVESANKLRETVTVVVPPSDSGGVEPAANSGDVVPAADNSDQ